MAFKLGDDIDAEIKLAFAKKTNQTTNDTGEVIKTKFKNRKKLPSNF